MIFESVVPAAGIEPARPKGQQILSLQRLPIPPRRHMLCCFCHEGKKNSSFRATLFNSLLYLAHKMCKHPLDEFRALRNVFVSLTEIFIGDSL